MTSWKSILEPSISNTFMLHLNSNPPFFLCLNTSFVFTNYQPIQRNAIMHIYCIQIFMSQILYINILVDWSLSGIMTSKLVIRESESPRPAASSILISRMTSSSVIIPYLMIHCNFFIDLNTLIWFKRLQKQEVVTMAKRLSLKFSLNLPV